MSKQTLWPLYLATIVALLNMEQAGVAVGWSSPVLTLLESEDSPIPTTSDEGSWITTILPLTSLFCTVLGSLSIQHLGRKLTILLIIIPYLISWILISFATTITELLIARGICGISLAMTFVVTPVYLGEISPDKLRGSIGVLMAVISNVGTLRIYCIGNIMDLWLSSLISFLPLILIPILYKWLPESPHYLISKNRKSEAEASLKMLRNSTNVDKELKQIEQNTAEYSQNSSFRELIQESSHRHALFISLGVVTIAQCTGGVTFLFYAHLIFQKAGNVSANLMSIIKASVLVFTSIGSAYVVDSVGKKPLLIISCIGSSIFMVCEGVYFYLHDFGYNVEMIWWLPLVAMILFNISHTAGLSPISIAYFGELFHPKVKSLAVCISKAYMAFVIFAIGKLYQVMTDYLGNCVPFFLFALVGLLGIVFVVVFVPETKGKSLNDIQYYMRHKTYSETNNTHL